MWLVPALGLLEPYYSQRSINRDTKITFQICGKRMDVLINYI